MTAVLPARCASLEQIIGELRAYLARKPQSCPAARTLTPVLEELTGKRRIGLTLPEDFAEGTGNLAGLAEVSWPVVGSGVDVVLVHNPEALPLPAVVQARMSQGPESFVELTDSHQLDRVVSSVNAEDIAVTRLRQLCGELKALIVRYPELRAELMGYVHQAREASGVHVVAAPHLTVKVIGPDGQRRRETEEELSRSHRITVTESVHCDVLLALAPQGGWAPGDARTLLASAQAGASVLLSTEALPAGMTASARIRVLDGELVEGVLQGWVITAEPVSPETWQRCTQRLILRRKVAMATLLGRGSQMAAAAQEAGVPMGAEIAPGLRAGEVIRAVVASGVAASAIGAAAYRLGAWLGLAVVLGAIVLVVALVAQALTVRSKEFSRREKGSSLELRAMIMAAESGRIPAGPVFGGARWLRRQRALSGK